MARPNGSAAVFARIYRQIVNDSGRTVETKIVANAKRKYALDELTARQIFGEVTAELGLTFVTASDAIQNLTAQIDQAVGDSSWLAREGWDRLRTAGSKWGLELEVVDEMIEERLAANRDEYLQRSYWTRLTLYGAGGAVIAASVIIVGLVLARSMKDDTPVVRHVANDNRRAATPQHKGQRPRGGASIWPSKLPPPKTARWFGWCWRLESLRPMPKIGPPAMSG